MKINKILLGAFALSMTFASCSNDEPAKGSTDPSDTTGSNYMAVTISNLGSGSGRATVGNPEFENAEGQEGTIDADNMYFLFFDGNGKAFPLAYANVNGTVETNMVKPISMVSNDETTGGDKQLTGTLVLGKPVSTPYVGEVPSKVVCVINPKTDVMKSLENKPLPEIIKQSTSPRPETWYGDGARFLMTSATYVKDGAVIQAIDIADYVKTTPEDAKNNPVKLYVERVVAKVRASYADNFTIQRRDGDKIETTGKFVLDNKEVTFTAEINGWQLYNTASSSYAFKQLEADYPNFDWKWNDPTNHRSYWANSNSGSPLGGTVYDLYEKVAEGAKPTQFTKKSYRIVNGENVTTTGLSNVAYCFENTEATTVGVTDRTPNKATGILMKATIKLNGEPINMFRWAGTYYTEDRLRQRIADAYSADNDNVEVDPRKVSFIEDAGKNTFHAAYDGNDMSTLFKDILWWKNGVTSYYTNIEHLGNTDETNLGVVRNHIYDYTVTGLIGLGVPGNKPDLPKESETFVACYIRILDWHVISNSVVLE